MSSLIVGTAPIGKTVAKVLPEAPSQDLAVGMDWKLGLIRLPG